MMRKAKKPAEKLDKKTVEKNRRIHMKDLCYKLTSLIPPQHLTTSKDKLSLPDQIDQAANYIRQLKERVDELAYSRKRLLGIGGDNILESDSGIANPTTSFGTPSLPRFEFKDFGSSLEVVLVSGVEKKFKLREIITILEEEGAEVMSAHVSTIGDKTFHTLHAQVRVSRVGVNTSSVCERLQVLTSHR